MNARPSLIAPHRCPVPALLLGRRVLGVEDVTRPWVSGVRTSLVTLEDGRRVVHQAGAPTVAGRGGIARRIRFARALRSAPPGLPVPEILDGDARANPPFAVTSYIPGEPGDALLATPAGAMRLGHLTGEAAAALAAVSTTTLGRSLPRTWADPDRLVVAAVGGLRGWTRPRPARCRTPPSTGSRGLLAGPPVLTHGDLAPVNLLVAGERAGGHPDLERLRLAPPLFDAAWFRLLVLHHHPERWPDAGPPLLAALGLPDDGATAAVLDDLAVLACLEMIPRSPAAHRDALPGRPAPASA